MARQRFMLNIRDSVLVTCLGFVLLSVLSEAKKLKEANEENCEGTFNNELNNLISCARKLSFRYLYSNENHCLTNLYL
jgi:hypothetical protein